MVVRTEQRHPQDLTACCHIWKKKHSSRGNGKGRIEGMSFVRPDGPLPYMEKETQFRGKKDWSLGLSNVIRKT